jgi:hypothetical protein
LPSVSKKRKKSELALTLEDMKAEMVGVNMTRFFLRGTDQFDDEKKR